LVNFYKVAVMDKKLYHLALTFSILIREYLNIVGWDYKKKYVKFGINIQFDYTGEFTQKNNCEDIPDLINDFVSCFIALDDNKFNLNMEEFVDIVRNFCNWLFVNDLTSYKITENDWEGIYGKEGD
jgi:hypothetical protein